MSFMAGQGDKIYDTVPLEARQPLSEGGHHDH